MAGSRHPGITQADLASSKLPGRTPGPLGYNDAADPTLLTLAGDTPGPLGHSDAGATAVAPAPSKPVKRGYAGAVPLRDRPDLFYLPEESPTFAKILAEAAALDVRIAPNDEMKPDDAATYDPQYNVVLLTVADFENRNVKNRSAVHQSTAHELVHAVQNRSILEKTADPEARARLLDQAILAWKTEEAFVQYHLKKEIAAETLAHRCDAEALDFFDRSQGRKGFDPNTIDLVVQQRVSDFVEQSKAAYEKRARELWRGAASR